MVSVDMISERYAANVVTLSNVESIVPTMTPIEKQKVNHMRLNALASSGLAVLAAAFTLTACSSSTPSGSTSSAPPRATSASSSSASTASGSSAARTGTFKGDNGKQVAGTVNVSDGKVVLSGFSSDAGPDLHIYLTDGASENGVSAGKQLGAISYDQSSQTFSLSGVDPSKYNTVVIHCDKAKAVFGDASLS
jgi:Electron transfer DM13